MTCAASKTGTSMLNAEPSESSPPPPEPAKNSKNGLMLWGGLVVAILVGNSLAAACPRLFGFHKLHNAVPGFVAGQLALMAVVGGLYRRAWLSGYLIATGLSVLGVAALSIGELVIMRRLLEPIEITDIFIPALAVPAFVLTASAPVLFCRFYFGWQLARPTGRRVHRQDLGVEDFLIVTAIVASATMLLAAIQDVSQIRSTEFWLPVGIAALVMVCCSACFVIPGIWVAFSIKNPRNRNRERAVRLVMLALMTNTIVVVAIAVVTTILHGANTVRSADLVGPSILTVTASATFVIGLLVLRKNGFSLNNNFGTTDVSEDHVETNSKALNRRLAISLVLLSVGTKAGLGLLLSSRDSKFEKLQSLHAKLSQRGGGLELDKEGNVVGLSLGSDATASDIKMVADFPHLRKLSLADGQFSDEDLIFVSSLENLRELDLSNVPITDLGILQLRFNQLHTLSLAGTNLTAGGIVDLLTTQHSILMSIDLSELQLTDQDMDRIVTQLAEYDTTEKISLRKNFVTSDGVARLLAKLPSISELDVSDCQSIDGELTKRLPDRHFSRLRLDRTKIDGKDLGAVNLNFGIHSLSANGIALDDTDLPAMKKQTVFWGLELKDAMITEEALAEVDYYAQRLGLNSPQYTGAVFEYWRPRSLQRLDMSGSNVSDREIAAIVKLPNLQWLDLSNTQVTDACLLHLATSDLNGVNLANTNITARGLANTRFPTLSYGQIYLSIDQFDTSQLNEIRKSITPSVGVKFPN